MNRFKAFLLNKTDDGLVSEIKHLTENDLPAGEVLVEVGYSSLNYKDGLAITGKGKIIRGEFPIVPGIDLAGKVVNASDERYTAGDRVLVTGWGIGEAYWGGYSQFAKLKTDWLVPLPENLGLKESMVIGTAGFTAMISVMALHDQGVTPDKGPVLVTGASGGVGSMAVAILAGRGYDVVASTGKESSHDWLRSLGASSILDRNEISDAPKRPMDKGLWAGAVDSVGSDTLAHVLSKIKTHGSVAACGLAAGHKLNTTVFPFILRGVNLLGIDSNTCPPARRKQAWQNLADELDQDKFNQIETVIGLHQLTEYAEVITNGKIQGRVVVDLSL